MKKEQHLGFYNIPPLWEEEEFGIRQFHFPTIDFKNFAPKSWPLNIRLGHQVEYIFEQLIAHSDEYKILVHNLQIQREKITLGEIDFVLRDKRTDRLIHVELTCKFYIIDTDIQESIHRLIGPNKRDSFYQKMNKIKKVQFPLLHSIEGVNALSHIKINHSEIEHQSCFKAQLFQPFGHQALDIAPFQTDCIAGYWIRRADFDNPDFSKATYYLPSKSEWIILPHHQVQWKSFTEIKKEINLHLDKEYAPMLWMKTGNSDIQKLFVVWW